MKVQKIYFCIRGLHYAWGNEMVRFTNIIKSLRVHGDVFKYMCIYTVYICKAKMKWEIMGFCTYFITFP